MFKKNQITQSNIKKAQQSLLDFLVDIMPELKVVRVKQGPTVEEKSLYSMWSDKTNKITGRKFYRPTHMSEAEINTLEKSGLIKIHGKHLRVTEKGAKVIRQMILSNDKSIFEKSSSSSSRIKIASCQTKRKSNNWYSLLKKL